MTILCPKCGSAPSRSITRFGLRLDCCGLWAWGDNPLADRETHEARKAAHAAFDPLWQSGKMSRSKAYSMLASIMGMTKEECHMKLITAEQARQVPGIVVQWFWEADEPKLIGGPK